jgi:hypothetical protein
VIEHGPKCVGLKRAEVKHNGNKNVSQSLFVQRQRKMMVIDDVVALFRT